MWTQCRSLYSVRTKAKGFRVFSPVARLAIPCENKRRLQAAASSSQESPETLLVFNSVTWLVVPLRYSGACIHSLASDHEPYALACRSRLHSLEPLRHSDRWAPFASIVSAIVSAIRFSRWPASLVLAATMKYASTPCCMRTRPAHFFDANLSSALIRTISEMKARDDNFE